MTDLFRVDRALCTVMGYPMSAVELIGTVLNLACVWLAAKKHVLNCPVGIVAVILFGWLFFKFNFTRT